MSIESCVLRCEYSGEYRDLCVVCGEYKNLVLFVAGVEIFVWYVTSIEYFVVCGEYSILCCLSRVYNLMLNLTSIEYCVVCDENKNLVLPVASVEIFVWFVTSIESFVVCCEIKILCCLGRV